MGRLSASFTFGRNALKRNALASAEAAAKAIEQAEKGVDLGVLKREDNGAYNIIRDLISFSGVLSRDGDDCAVTKVGETFKRLYAQNAEDAWRWLIARSLWLYVVPNGTQAAVNQEAKALGTSFSFFGLLLGVLAQSSSKPGKERYLYYEELCELLDDDANWSKSADEVYLKLNQRRSTKGGFTPSSRSLLGDLENSFGIPRDNLNGVLNKAFQQTGLFEYAYGDGGRVVAIALSSALDPVLQRRIRFLLDHPTKWDGGDWGKHLSLRGEDLPEEVSFAQSAVQEEVLPAQAIEALVQSASTAFAAAGLQFDEEVLRRFAAALLAKRLVILTGLSGSGKTKLAQSFARWISPRYVRASDVFSPGTELKSDRATYTVEKADTLSVELHSSESETTVILPRGLIDEWTAYIKATSGAEGQSARTIREAVAKTTHYSPQLNSFETHLKTAALAALAAETNVAPHRGYELVSVGADWASRENSIGYVDALTPGKFVRTTPIVELMLRAVQRPEVPHFLILDEMNLSHVERYFADFLSALESGEPLSLHQHLEIVDGVPPSLLFPTNLFVIGTVNVDETTYTFSPKVLDRANCIEFRIDSGAIEAQGRTLGPVAFEKIDGEGRSFAKTFVLEARRSRLSVPEDARLIAELRLLFDTIAPYGSEFGFRTVVDVSRFVHFHQRLTSSGWDLSNALDAQILQKVLPKLNGTRRKLEPILCALAVITHRRHEWDSAQGRITNRDVLLDVARKAGQLDDEKLHPLLSRSVFEGGQPPAFPLSYTKVIRMLDRLAVEGFASFAEA